MSEVQGISVADRWTIRALLHEYYWFADHGPIENIIGLYTEDGHLIGAGKFINGWKALREEVKLQTNDDVTRHVSSNLRLTLLDDGTVQGTEAAAGLSAPSRRERQYAPGGCRRCLLDLQTLRPAGVEGRSALRRSGISRCSCLTDLFGKRPRSHECHKALISTSSPDRSRRADQWANIPTNPAAIAPNVRA